MRILLMGDGPASGLRRFIAIAYVGLATPTGSRIGASLFVINKRRGAFPRSGFAQRTVLKRSSSAMKLFSPKPFSLEPKGICARSFQLVGSSQVLATSASISGP